MLYFVRMSPFFTSMKAITIHNSISDLFVKAVDFYYLILIAVQGSRCRMFCKILVRKLLYCIKDSIKLIVFYQEIISRCFFL